MLNLSVKERREALQQFVSKAMLASMGLYPLPKPEAQKLIDGLYDLGKLSKEDGEKILVELAEKVEKARLTFEGSLEAGVEQTIKRIEVAAEETVTELTRKVAELEARVENIAKRKAQNP